MMLGNFNAMQMPIKEFNGIFKDEFVVNKWSHEYAYNTYFTFITRCVLDLTKDFLVFDKRFKGPEEPGIIWDNEKSRMTLKQLYKLGK